MPSPCCWPLCWWATCWDKNSLPVVEADNREAYFVVKFRFVMELPLALVVGNALRLGGAGLLRCEGQHHQGDDIGQHVIHGAGQVQIAQQVEAAVHIAQGPEEAEQQRRQGDAGGLPLAEDHHRQGQEAETGHAVFKLPLADARDDIHNAARPPIKTSKKRGLS